MLCRVFNYPLPPLSSSSSVSPSWFKLLRGGTKPLLIRSHQNHGKSLSKLPCPLRGQLSHCGGHRNHRHQPNQKRRRIEHNNGGFAIFVDLVLQILGIHEFTLTLKRAECSNRFCPKHFNLTFNPSKCSELAAFLFCFCLKLSLKHMRFDCYYP